MKALQDTLSELNKFCSLSLEWTDDNKKEILNNLIKELNYAKEELKKSPDQIYYGFKILFLETLSILLYARAYSLCTKQELEKNVTQVVASLNRIANKLRIIKLLKKYANILEFLKRARTDSASYNDEITLIRKLLNQYDFHQTLYHVIRLYEVLFSGKRDDEIRRLLLENPSIIKSLIELNLFLSSFNFPHKSYKPPKHDCISISAIINIILKMNEILGNELSAIFEEICFRALSDINFWKDLIRKKFRVGFSKTLTAKNLSEIISTLRRAMMNSDINLGYTGLRVKMDGNELFDGLIEILEKKEPYDERRHLIVVFIECKIELFSECYNEVQRLRKQLKRKIKIIKETLAPYYYALNSRIKPLFVYLILINKRASKEILLLLEELSEKNSELGILMTPIAGKPLLSLIKKYLESTEIRILENIM